MSVWNYLKGVFAGKERARMSAWLANSAPIFSSFGQDIYLSDFVNNAIDRTAVEISKIDIKSIVQRGDSLNIQNDDITRLFRFKPNPLQTTSDFLSNVEWLRRKNCNAFIYPQYEIVTTPAGSFRRYTAFYPLNPLSVYIGTDDIGRVWEVQFDFADGSSWRLPYADLIHLKWRRGMNTIVGGGDDYGLPMIRDVLRTVESLDKTIQGLPKSIEASLQIKGVYHAKTLADAEKLKGIRDDFETHIMTSKNGMVATDLGGEFTPVKIDPATISSEALTFLRAVLHERYGVSAAILSGDYTGEQHSAFYQTAIEDVIVQIEQAFTACLYTEREHDVGHRIKCYYSKVQYLSTQDKIELTKISNDTGLMTKNEIREMLGQAPVENGNVYMQSLNYIDSAIANQYQMSGQAVQGQTAQGDSTDPAADAGTAQTVAEDVAGKGLNGAQTQSLLATMEQYTSGKLTLGQAVNIIAIAIGISKSAAKKIIEGIEDEE